MTTSKTKPRIAERPGVWLALGAALTVAANMRWGIGLLAWLAPIALLHALRLSSGLRSRLLFAGVLIAAWVGATAKIVTPPIPPGIALLGVGFGLVQLPGYLLADRVRRKLGEGAGIASFAALMTALEWAQHRFTELGSWGAAVYTQLDDLPLLQLAAVFGSAGVSLLVYWFAAGAEALYAAGSATSHARTARKHLLAALGAIALAHGYGAWRLHGTLAEDVRVAAIGTDATFDGRVTPSDAERARTLDHLLADTHRAALAGAKLAIWTEGSALVLANEEPRFLQVVQAAAARDRVQIVAAYIVPLSDRPLRYENKYRWVRADGTLDHTYFKHHPVPGEPAVRGEGPLPIVESELGKLSGALCYDYDFPALAAEHGARGVDLVALPSSDWRGIDPIHTQMASLRAIEQGLSIVRSTRFGLSAGIDPFGRLRAQHSSFDDDQRVLLLSLPQHGVATIYRSLGDVLIYACLAWLVVVLARYLASSSAVLAAPADALAASTRRRVAPTRRG